MLARPGRDPRTVRARALVFAVALALVLRVESARIIEGDWRSSSASAPTVVVRAACAQRVRSCVSVRGVRQANITGAALPGGSLTVLNHREHGLCVFRARKLQYCEREIAQVTRGGLRCCGGPRVLTACVCTACRGDDAPGLTAPRATSQSASDGPACLHQRHSRGCARRRARGAALTTARHHHTQSLRHVLLRQLHVIDEEPRVTDVVGALTPAASKCVRAAPRSRRSA